ncbi:MAG: LysM peptidoglycan-binding domain-containing protein [Gemmatimonadetes bacterium]|nr:LysM peptidoglycan-binding domain-containing protein [Gemmatimonadota bacterium]
MNGATRALVLVTAILAVAPAAGAQDTGRTHRVRTGDTLWELAAQYLADPFRWPELYDLNVAVVEDPHWIFPGESLDLPGEHEGAAERTVQSPERRAVRVAGERKTPREAQDSPGDARRSFGATGEFPEGSVFRADPSAPSYGDLSIEQTEPRAVVSMSDFYSAAILADQSAFVSAGLTARVVSEAHPSIKLPRAARLNDQVVLHLTGVEVGVGDYLKAVQWGRSMGIAGHVLYTVGAVRVTRTYPSRDSVRAEVVQVFGDYRVGDLMLVAEEYPIVPGIQSEVEEGGTVGTVLGFTEDQTLVATTETLFLDVGALDGVQVGDLFAVFPATATAETALIEDRLSLVRVVHTSDETSTARVTAMRDAGMRPGTPVRRVERMPQ